MKGRLVPVFNAEDLYQLVDGCTTAQLFSGHYAGREQNRVTASLLLTGDNLQSMWNRMCAVISELKNYQRDFLRPVTAQPSHHASVPASIMEQHTAELTAAQEWDNEWNSQGLLSRLNPQASLHTHD